MFTYIIMDAKSNENTPAIACSLVHEDKYMYACVFMYNMHILDKITCQVSRKVHIMIQETFTHIIMGAEHNETTPTIQFYLSHEDYDVHSTQISRKRKKIHIVESMSGHVYTH